MPPTDDVENQHVYSRMLLNGRDHKNFNLKKQARDCDPTTAIPGFQDVTKGQCSGIVTVIDEQMTNMVRGCQGCCYSCYRMIWVCLKNSKL